MISVEALKNKVLDLAMHGKLVAQDPQDEPAIVLVEKIKEKKTQLIKDKKIKKTKAFPPIEEDEIPYKIPDSWEWVRMGEVVNFGEQIKPNRKFKYIDVKSIDNQHQKIDYTKINEILPQDAPSRARKKIKKNDLIYSTVRPYLHNLAIFEEDGDFIASTAFEVIKSTNNKFLKYQMLSSDFDAQVNSNSTGSSYPAINHSNFIRMKIALPPQQEQQRIVDKIEEIFAELDKLGEVSQKYDECKELLNKRVLDLAMHGKLVAQDPQDEPASALVEKIKEERAQLIKDKKIRKSKALPPIEEDEIPYEIPDSWEWVRLGKLLFVKSGKAFKRKNLVKSGDYPVYGANGIIGYANDYNVKSKKLLLGRVGSVGEINIIEEKAWITDNALIVNLFDDELFDYMYKLFEFIDFNKYASGAVQPVISGKRLYNIVIPLPPQQEQQRIVDKIEEIFDTLREI